MYISMYRLLHFRNAKTFTKMYSTKWLNDQSDYLRTNATIPNLDTLFVKSYMKLILEKIQRRYAASRNYGL